MAKKNTKQKEEAIKSIMEQDGEFLRPLVQMVVQAVLEAEMEEALGAKKGERKAGAQPIGRIIASKRHIRRPKDIAHPPLLEETLRLIRRISR